MKQLITCIVLTLIVGMFVVQNGTAKRELESDVAKGYLEDVDSSIIETPPDTAYDSPFRLFPCPGKAEAECTYSHSSQREVCYYKTKNPCE